ncbi:MAG: lipoprotein-releasing system transmembrane subunit LolC, partial [Alphaproteobacteria bacterium]|nr:lipoprotein-releasing system transmembrane subunit LolC [Alphaproteobacteria bacterium]
MFFSLFERKIAWRYLRPNRQEGFISVIAGFSFLGITIGVATLIIVMSVMNGFREELFSKILGFNGHLRIEGISGHLRDFDELADKVRPFYGVESVTPLVEGQAMAMSKGTATGIIVRGVRKDDLKDRPIISDNIVDGSLADLEGTDAIVIGQALALRMGVRVGDPLTLVAPELNATAFGSIPRSKKYTVVGLFQSGNYEYDKGIVFLPLEAAQVFYRTGEGVTGLEIFLLSPNLVDITAPKMAKALNWRVNIRDWRQSNAAFFQAVNVERNVMFLILTLIILIAAFNIVSSLIMLVKDKTRDIAI